MDKINPKKLIKNNSLFESLFAPLYFKASETRHAKPIIKDDKAIEILESLDYDFSYFEKNTSGQFLISVRTKILDEQVNEFINVTDNPVIINLGSGLDTRLSRVESAKVTYWYDLDFPEVINFRKNFYPDTENHISIGKSALDYSWIQDVCPDPKYDYLFIAEGLLMYLHEQEIKDLFNQISKHFPLSTMLCEIFHTKLINYNVKNEANNKDIKFKWGISNNRDLESLHPGIKIENEWKMFDYFKNRQKIFVRILVNVSSRFQNMVKIIKLRFNEH